MMPFKLLVVEDSAQDLETCKVSIARYLAEKQRQIDLVECATLEDALATLDNSFDGAIVDLKLANEGNAGTQVIKRVVDSYFRIPIAVFTGTPDSADAHFSYVGVFKKGETTYAELFDIFWNIHNTGLTRIMGGRGIIEKTLNQVFLKNILPQRETWIKHGSADSPRTEKALLRHTLNHLLQSLDCDDDVCFPEEVYIVPPIGEAIVTGTILRAKEGGSWFVILNPACDLVIRANGDFKTDRLFLVEIEKEETVVAAALADITKKAKKENKLEAVFANNHTGYFHWLPKTSFFPGGFINFRKAHTLTKQALADHFYSPELQISLPFVKDIVSRFSTYYARQGQPEIECVGRISEFAQ